MFSTFLKEIKDVFNKWALISAFYPSLVFWTLTAALVVSQEEGWSKVREKLDSWEKQSLTLLAFLVWVSFWSFLIINFQPSMVRLFEGYWPFKWLTRIRRKFWQRQWTKMREKDSLLASKQAALYTERKAFEALRNTTDVRHTDEDLNAQQVDEFLEYLQEQLNRRSGAYGGGEYVRVAWSYWNCIRTHLETGVDGNMNWFVRSVRLMEALGRLLAKLEGQSDKFVARARLVMSKSENSSASPSQLRTLGRQTRAYWQNINSYLDSPLNSEWLAGRSKKLMTIMDTLLIIVKQQQEEVDEQRQDHNREFLLYYPPGRDDVMPTRIGNVLKGADKRIYSRYRLDPAIMWSRLQPQLTKEFAETLQNVKGPFDLMVTLSAFSIFFGLLLFGYESIIHLRKPWFILVFVLTIGLCVNRIASKIVLVGLILAVIWSFAAFLNLDLPPPNAVSPFKPLLALILCAWLLAWVAYENAVQACIVYCEKIQTAFDLYRWKILDEMHLQLPPNLEEERDTWKDVCELLYRSHTPRPFFYRYTSQDKKTKDVVRPLTRLVVPQKALPPYYRITANEVTEIEIPEARVPIDAIREKQGFLGKLSIRALAGGEPVPRSHVVDPKNLEDVVVIGLQVDASRSPGENLRVGDRVILIIEPMATTAASAVSQAGTNALDPIIIENTLILDVKTTADNAKLSLVVAIPLARRSDYINNSNGTFLIISEPQSRIRSDRLNLDTEGDARNAKSGY